MAKSFRIGATIDPTDPAVIACKRKQKYPTFNMAQRAAIVAQARTKEEILPYQCPVCERFHIGHPPQFAAPAHVQETEVVVTGTEGKKPRPPKVWLDKKKFPPTTLTGQPIALIDTSNLAKLVDDFRMFYIFQMPEGMPISEKNVLEHGVMVAMKNGEDFFREKDGSRSPVEKWRAYHAMSSLHVRNLVDFKRKIQPHLDIWERYLEEASSPQPLKNTVLKERIEIEAKPEPKPKRAYNRKPKSPVTHIPIPPEFQAKPAEETPEIEPNAEFDHSADEREWLTKTVARELMMKKEADKHIHHQPDHLPFSDIDLLFLNEVQDKVTDFTIPSGQIRGIAWAMTKHIKSRLSCTL